MILKMFKYDELTRIPICKFYQPCENLILAYVILPLFVF